MMNPEYRNVCFKLEEFELPPTFAIITAHNPDGLTQSDPANQDADEALRLLITATGLPHFRITGMSRDEVHQEPGWGIACSKNVAIAWGKQCKQQAIFWVEQGELILIDLVNLAAIKLGAFSKFLKPV
jgi:hypothetical protein